MTTRWFVACRYASAVELDDTRRAASTAHAKQMGTTVTACGTAADSMTKLFDVRFPVDGDNCAACLAAVAASAPPRPSSPERQPRR